jgi:hypothetical protein
MAPYVYSSPRLKFVSTETLPLINHFVNVYITIDRYDAMRTVTHMLPSLHRIYATPYRNLHKFQKPFSI